MCSSYQTEQLNKEHLILIEHRRNVSKTCQSFPGWRRVDMQMSMNISVEDTASVLNPKGDSNMFPRKVGSHIYVHTESQSIRSHGRFYRHENHKSSANFCVVIPLNISAFGP
jgi:hypothetical protein